MQLFTNKFAHTGAMAPLDGDAMIAHLLLGDGSNLNFNFESLGLLIMNSTGSSLLLGRNSKTSFEN